MVSPTLINSSGGQGITNAREPCFKSRVKVSEIIIIAYRRSYPPANLFMCAPVVYVRLRYLCDIRVYGYIRKGYFINAVISRQGGRDGLKCGRACKTRPRSPVGAVGTTKSVNTVSFSYHLPSIMA